MSPDSLGHGTGRIPWGARGGGRSWRPEEIPFSRKLVSYESGYDKYTWSSVVHVERQPVEQIASGKMAWAQNRTRLESVEEPNGASAVKNYLLSDFVCTMGV